MSNAEVLELLGTIAARLGRLELAVGVKGGGGGGGDTEETHPSVEAFDAQVKEKVVKFAAASEKIGLTDMAAQANEGYNGMRTLFDMASKCHKPASQGDVMKYADGMVKQVRASSEAKDKARGTPHFNHKVAWADACSGAFSWTVMGPTPVPKTIQEAAIDSSMFYINKIRKESPDDEDQKKWYQSLLQLLNGLKEYCAEYHKAGLEWKAKGLGGKDPATYKSGGGGAPAAPAAGARGPRPPRGAPRGPPPPLPPAPAVAAAPAGPAGDAAALFAEIRNVQERQKGGATSGLRKVKKDASGKKYVEDDQEKRAKSAAAVKKKFGSGSVPRKTSAVTQKQPVKLLQAKKWRIEHQTGVCELSADEVNVKQTVYIFGCTGATVVVNGKVNSITMDGCSRTNVVFDNMIAGIEIVNCKNVKVQARKNCNTVAIDKTDGIVVYVSRECMDTVTITASKSSEMNVSFPGATDEEDNIERPIPEQYVHKIVDGKLTAEVSELYGE